MTKKLTKAYVDTLPLSEKRATYWDSELKGFGLRIGATSKTYICETKINGKTVRVTVGKHGVFAPDQARAEAKTILANMSRGINPNDVKKEIKARTITLEESFIDFLAARKSLKPRTIYDYRRMMNNYFNDWLKFQLVDITKDMVAKRHAKLSEHGKAQANLAMRLLRSLFNFAAGRYENCKGQTLISENPVKRLSQTRAWYRVDRRQTLIKLHELKTWYEAVINKCNDCVRDYLLLILFTGLRRQEAARIKWTDIDLAGKTLTVKDTKNHTDHTLPLSTYLYDLFVSRKKESTSEYVFPSNGKDGYLVEPRKQIDKVIEASNIDFTIHDLRRTFITIAESLDIPSFALKRLINHRSGNYDVTAGYIIMDIERLRKPMQKITDYLLTVVGVLSTEKIISLETKKEKRN